MKMADEGGGIASKVQDVYSIITTTRAKYFGRVSANGEKGIVIENAYEFSESEPKVIADGFFRGKLYGETRRIELSDALVESVTEAPDETRIIRTYEALMPEAEKRALGVMTWRALQDLLQR
jgi:hypothetical protein